MLVFESDAAGCFVGKQQPGLCLSNGIGWNVDTSGLFIKPLKVKTFEAKAAFSFKTLSRQVFKIQRAAAEQNWATFQPKIGSDFSLKIWWGAA